MLKILSQIKLDWKILNEIGTYINKARQDQHVPFILVPFDGLLNTFFNIMNIPTIFFVLQNSFIDYLRLVKISEYDNSINQSEEAFCYSMSK